MKRLMIVAAIIGLSSVLRAEEFSGNPDRFPSVGLWVSGGTLKGDDTISAEGLSTKQDVHMNNAALNVDFRVPVSNSLSLMMGASAITSSSKSDETNILTADKTDLDGYSGFLGVRIFIH